MLYVAPEGALFQGGARALVAFPQPLESPALPRPIGASRPVVRPDSLVRPSWFVKPVIFEMSLVGEGLDLCHPGAGAVHEPATIAGFQSDVRGNNISGVREAQAIDRLDEVSAGIENLDAAAVGGRTRNRLGHEEQTMHGIVLDIGATEYLLFAGPRQDYGESGLRFKIVEFHAGVVFAGRARKVVGRIDGDTVHETKSDAGKFGERSLAEVGQANHRSAAEASIPSSENCLVGHWVVSHGRRHAAKVERVLDLDDRAKGIGGNLVAKDPGDEVAAVVVGEDRGVRRSLGATNFADQMLLADGPSPLSRELVRTEGPDQVKCALHIQEADHVFVLDESD